jgi:hypothetical protein
VYAFHLTASILLAFDAAQQFYTSVKVGEDRPVVYFLSAIICSILSTWGFLTLPR